MLAINIKSLCKTIGNKTDRAKIKDHIISSGIRIYNSPIGPCLSLPDTYRITSGLLSLKKDIEAVSYLFNFPVEAEDD